MKKFIFLFFVLALLSCRNNSKSDALSMSDNYLRDKPERVLRILDSIGYDEHFSEADKMHFVWNKAKAHHSLGESLVEDTLLPKSIAYYSTFGDKIKLLEGYLLLASYHNWKGERSKVIATLEKGYQQAIKLNNAEMVVLFLGAEAEFYYRQHEYTLSIHKFKELLKLSKYLSIQQQYQYTFMLGLSLSLASDPSYSEYYDKSIVLALAAGDTISACEFIRNYAGSLSGNFLYHNSNEQLHKLVALMPQLGKLSVIQMSMAENYINLRQLDLARECLKSATASENTLREQGYSDLSRKGSLEMLKYLLDYDAGQKVSFATFSRYCDSISNDVRMRRDSEIKQLETKHRLQAVNVDLRYQRDQMLWYIILITLTVITGAIGGYFYVRNRYQHLAEREDRVDALIRLMEDAKSSVTDTPQSEDNAFFKKILMKQLGIIKLVASAPTNQNQALLRRISAISDGEIPVDELLSWPDLYPIIDSLYDNFYTRLMNKYSEILKDKEIKICCLLCVGFSTKEIGVVTQQSDATIYVRKSAIRRKIGIDEKQDIVDFINRMSHSS